MFISNKYETSVMRTIRKISYKAFQKMFSFIFQLPHFLKQNVNIPKRS